MKLIQNCFYRILDFLYDHQSKICWLIKNYENIKDAITEIIKFLN
jgi:hypothetical protein